MLAGKTEDNDKSGSKAEITRKLLFLKPKNLSFVWDFFESKEGNGAISQFILNGSNWRMTPKGATSLEQGFAVDIQAVGDIALEVSLDPVDVSPAYLQKAKGFRLSFRRPGKLAARIVTVIHWDKESPEMEIGQDSASCVRVQCGAETIRCFVHAGEKTIIEEELDTDAGAACLVEREGEIRAAWALNVSKLKFSSKTLLDNTKMIERWSLV